MQNMTGMLAQSFGIDPNEPVWQLMAQPKCFLKYSPMSPSCLLSA
jgi:hypothetical protein